PQDRRSSLLKLTAKGRTQLAQISAAYNQWVCSLFEQLPDQDLQHMMQSLDELKKHSLLFAESTP
ncbi:MAG TPA: winged helix-turn-helix transcriptional regulator, partial [Alcaligenaceae bacterium]|nr:winged helix-turn-helix transcriptional regulator [Alcaligenaceae bacterium]